jgi:hypothetical protein
VYNIILDVLIHTYSIYRHTCMVSLVGQDAAHRQTYFGLATCTVRGLDKADIGIFGSTTTEASSARLHLLCVPRSPEHLLQRLTGWPFLRWGRGHHCGDWLHGQATFCSGQGSVSCWDMALCEVGVQQELEYSKNSGHVPRVPQRIASLRSYQV